MCVERWDAFVRQQHKMASDTFAHSHKLKTHTDVRGVAGGEMRWMQGSKWFLIDALHPLFHYLQARLIILTSRDSKVDSSCRIHETNTKREPRIANGKTAPSLGDGRCCGLSVCGKEWASYCWFYLVCVTVCKEHCGLLASQISVD